MLNYLWALMLLVGVLYGAFQGRLPDLTGAALDSAKEAVTLCITMTGVMSLWVGLMEIAQKSGIIRGAARLLQPFMDFMFPELPREHKAREYMTTNIIANIFGLGWAATPAGLKAMEALRDLEEERRSRGVGRPKGTAGNEMCTFLVLNIASLQLIPINIIAYRIQYGSENPAAILAPSLAATLLGAVAAVLFCKSRNLGRKGRRAMIRVLLYLSEILVPFLIFYVVARGLAAGRPVYEDFIKGAEEGFQTVIKIMPTLVGLMTAVGVLRASGFLEFLGEILAPVTKFLHFPAELVPLTLVRMFSASAATGLALDVFKEYGPDSYLGLVTSILMGCTETIFYTMSIYFMTAGVKKTRYTLPGALLATAVGIGASVWLGGQMALPG